MLKPKHAAALAPPPGNYIKIRPARRIVTASGKRARGLHCSIKYRKLLAWESSLERAALHRLEFSGYVTNVWSQPYCVTIPDEHGVFEYTPDILAIDNAGQAVFIECKPQEQLAKAEIKNRMATLHAFFTGLGARFLVCDEHQLCNTISLRNVEQLMRHRRLAAHAGDIAQFRTRVFDDPPPTFGSLLQMLPSTVAMHAIANGWLHFDFNQPLGTSTPLFTEWKGDCDAASFIRPW